MGNNASKNSSGKNGSTNKIPSDSSLGQTLRYWSDNLRQKEARDD
jgi:hypothetical protein